MVSSAPDTRMTNQIESVEAGKASGESLTCPSGPVSHPMGEGQAGPGDEMLTKKELSVRLKITVRTVENWQRRGLLPFVKISKVVLFYWPDVVDHLKANFRVCRRGGLRAGR